MRHSIASLLAAILAPTIGLFTPSAHATDKLQIPLVVALWHDAHFGGSKRTLVTDTPNLARTAFNDQTSSVGVHPGPDYAAWKQAHGGREPTVTLFVDTGGRGASIVLRAGVYPDLHVQGFNDRASSVYFTDDVQKAISPSGPAAPISFIPIVAVFYTDSRYEGTELTIVESTRDIGADYGSNFNDSISSARFLKGPNYGGQSAAELCIDRFFDRCLAAFTPDSFGGYDFHSGAEFRDPTPLNDSISSVRIR